VYRSGRFEVPDFFYPIRRSEKMAPSILSNPSYASDDYLRTRSIRMRMLAWYIPDRALKIDTKLIVFCY